MCRDGRLRRRGRLPEGMQRREGEGDMRVVRVKGVRMLEEWGRFIKVSTEFATGRGV